MFGFVVNTSVGSFQVWNEVGAQLLGISAAELMAINRGSGLPLEVKERVCHGEWQLIMEDAVKMTTRKRLVKAWRETQPKESINTKVKEEVDSNYVDALTHLQLCNQFWEVRKGEGKLVVRRGCVSYTACSVTIAGPFLKRTPP